MTLVKETGYAIKLADGTVRGRPIQSSGGGRAWQLYKTKAGAERRIKRYVGYVGNDKPKIIRATLTIIEETMP